MRVSSSGSEHSAISFSQRLRRWMKTALSARQLRRCCFLAATSWLLASCSPPGAPLENPGHDRFTGGTTEDGRKHTAGSDDNALETLKTSIDGDNEANRDFAQWIESVDMGLLDSNGRPISTAPA